MAVVRTYEVGMKLAIYIGFITYKVGFWPIPTKKKYSHLLLGSSAPL